MRIFAEELFIRRLKGDLPWGSAFDWVRGKSTEECVESLRKLSGQDFGHDASAWEDWWAKERRSLDIDPDF